MAQGLPIPVDVRRGLGFRRPRGFPRASGSLVPEFGPGGSDAGKSDTDMPKTTLGQFGREERLRQARFRESLSAPSDAFGRRHGHLLALGHELENLYPALRSANGACRYFEDRQIKWWQAGTSGDASNGKRPTRNMASSQIACVNFLLPLIDVSNALTAVLQALDDDVAACADIPGPGTSSPVELEWIGLDHVLEGPTIKSRGANSTSVDAFMVGETPVGRRAYLMEWKYVEEYRTDDKGKGRQGRTRRSRYAHLYEESHAFVGRCSLRGLAVRTVLPDRAASPACRSDGSQPGAGCLRSQGDRGRAGGKSSLSGTGHVALVLGTVPEPHCLRHRPPYADRAGSAICRGIAENSCRRSTKPVWGRGRPLE